MPRKKLIRRFEPRYGVSREMIELESKYVAREIEDHLLLSADDLSKRLDEIRSRWRQADAIAERCVRALGAREALAFQCLIARDLYHILELYCQCLSAVVPARPDETTAPPPDSPNKTDKEEEKIIPFGEWLF
jgi:hypothetical protein